MRCTSCVAEVDRTDRFCPACGTPNRGTGLHPKLDAGRHQRDPFELGPVPAGPSCPRCTGPIRRPEGFCRACGLQLDDVWLALDRAPADGVWVSPGPTNLDPYRPLRVPALVLRVALGVGATLAAASVVVHLWAAARLGGQLSATGPSTASLLDAVRMVDLVGVGVFTIAAIGVLVWMNRAYRNLPATAVSGLRLRPAWAVGGWFVPIADLVVPKLIMDDLWRANDPATRPRSSSWRLAPAPVWSGVWWACLLTGTLLAVGAGLAAGGVDLGGPAAGDRRTALWLAGLASLALVGAALSLLVLVRRITDRAEVRVARLGAPAALARLRVPAAGLLDPSPSLVRVHDAEHPVWGRY